MSAALPSEEWLESRDELARDLVVRLIDLFGIQRTGKVLWEAYCIWKRVYQERDADAGRPDGEESWQ